MLKAWAKGGDAWLSARLLSAKPEPHWNWVEGDDPRVKWDDIYKFFAQLHTERCRQWSGRLCVAREVRRKRAVAEYDCAQEASKSMSVDSVARDNKGFK